MAQIGVPAVGRGEAQLFNLGPFYAMAQQEKLLKQQQQQQLDKYIAADLSKLSPEGIRPQDMPQFLQKYNELKNLSIQYRDAIKNPAKNPKAWQDYEAQKASLSAYLAESKAAKEDIRRMYDFRGRNLDKIDNDSFIAAMQLKNAPLGSQQYEQGKGYDQSQILFKPDRFDVNKWQTFLNGAVKPVARTTPRQLPTGQIEVDKIQYRDPQALATMAEQGFDADLGNAKKFYTTQFDTLDEPTKQALENYAAQYFPDFKIETPKDYAVAANLYGKVEQDMGTTIGGTPWLSVQARIDARQRNAEAAKERRARKKEEGKFLWETATAEAMKRNDPNAIEKLRTELESASPGVDHFYLKQGWTRPSLMQQVLPQIKKSGIDAKTRMLTDQDFKEGVMVVAVPITNKKGERTGTEFMAVSARDPYLQNRLNRLRNYAGGGPMKPLTDVIYQEPEDGEEINIETGEYNQ